MNHVLVTNDFPPKVGGIQSYLYELWRRLPHDQFAVLTANHPGARAWDNAQAFRIERVAGRMLLPGPALARRIERLAGETGAGLAVLDPVVPLGLVSRWLDIPTCVVVHGAEITIPGRIPGYRRFAASVLDAAELVVAAGDYPLAEAERAVGHGLRAVVVPPGVDSERFHPLDEASRAATRERFGIDPVARVVLGVSRLVHRKGFDVLLRAGARLAHGRPDLRIVIGGEGRDHPRLARIAKAVEAPVTFLGAVSESDLPALYGCADVFAMLCRNRWFGLEQEGFGIVFLEAAACGVPQIAGLSGGSHEAVVDNRTGLVVARPASTAAVEAALARLLANPGLRAQFGDAARHRAEQVFDEDRLAVLLADALAGADRGDTDR